ncbi:MAG: NADH-quinone oxidoreductase subunit I, partial [Promethearchaeota archaeon]
MEDINYYEKVRQNLTLGPLKTHKHKKVIQLMKVLWNEEEIKLLSHFNKAGNWITKQQLAERSNIPKDQIKKILSRSVKIGTIASKINKYSLLPIIPGIFEKYFIARKDTEENQKKAARLYRDIMKEVLPQNLYASEGRAFRPLLPYDAKEKLIEINKSLDYKSQALPYELVKQLIDDNEYFAVIPCQCRLIGELSGEPCDVAPAEMGCFLVGPAAQNIAYRCDDARILTKEEAIQFLKDTEKAGLVHNSDFGSGQSGVFICNCCSCHCGALYPARLMHIKGTKTSNFNPKINMELCVKCETCVKKCPGEAIFHIWPKESDSSDEIMVV